MVAGQCGELRSASEFPDAGNFAGKFLKSLIVEIRKVGLRLGNFDPEKPDQGKAEGNFRRGNAGRFGGALR